MSNNEFLGDALDFWKGGMFKRLCEGNLLKDLHVEPMITDKKEWKHEELTVYSKILQLKSIDKIIHSEPFIENRHNYFESIKYNGDLFLDPDTGITTSSVTKKHITKDEIDFLLAVNNNRVLAVYQHNAIGKNIRDRVNQIITFLKQTMIGSYFTSYESSTVAMIFISKDKKRIDDIYYHECRLFGPVNDKRTQLFQ